MTDLEPSDLTVIIPTRDRWPILTRTLAALSTQSVGGFSVLVVVDGEDQVIPTALEANVVVKAHAGPGSARNAGVAASRTDLILFVGDDIIPEPGLIAAHLDLHNRLGLDEVVGLGAVRWHPEVAADPVAQWLDWSGTQFEFDSIDGEHAGFGHFYSCNVSLRRSLFEKVDGFDESFTYYYEDLDLGYRLSEVGMDLRYVPEALGLHVHRYDLDTLRRRFRGTAIGEHAMAAKHPWFKPPFLERVLGAARRNPVSKHWAKVAPSLDSAPAIVRSPARDKANTWYLQQLADDFLAGWSGARDLEELRAYLGDDFDTATLFTHSAAVDNERDGALDETTFYRTSQNYLYDLTVFAMSGTKAPYLSELRHIVRPGARLLDYGCGIGADGLRLIDGGYNVSFADFDNPSVAYLRWRLAHRGVSADIYDVEHDVIAPGFNLAYSFDVIEHVDEPFDFLARMEAVSDIVMVNFLEEDHDDTDLHRPLDIPALLDHCAHRGLIRYRRYHDRSHLVAYRSKRSSRSSAASLLERRLGPRLNLQPGWFPVLEST